jgi:hypothetical protein
MSSEASEPEADPAWTILIKREVQVPYVEGGWQPKRPECLVVRQMA